MLTETLVNLLEVVLSQSNKINKNVEAVLARVKTFFAPRPNIFGINPQMMIIHVRNSIKYGLNFLAL